MAKDPVCGREIDQEEARAETGLTAHGASEVDPQKGTRSFYEGIWDYFCGLECRSKFLAGPNTYLGKAEA